MSQCVDDSPVSDNKMDISEPTNTSQESSVISPESDRLANDDDLLFACNKTNIKADQSGQMSLENFKNRNIVSHSSLTLVDEHPLMLLNADENDSTEKTVPRATCPAAHSIPDVVPAQDHSPNNDSLASPSRGANDNKTDFRNKESFSSDESDPDVSQYQAYLEPTYQSVALTNCATAKTRQPLRKIPLTPELMSRDDPSSVETFSSNSFDEDFDEIDAAITSSQITESNNKSCSNVANDTGFSELDDPKESAIESSAPPRQLLSVTLADGQRRDIDMKVIEPYKRVLSHGGYLKAGGHNAIVIFSACFLPDRSRTDYNYVMENLFLYVIKTLDQFVTEDYVLIYLHGGSTRRTVPPFPWLKKCYQLLDRRIRKSLKNLYMVHPTFWLKSLVWMTRPFISSKFWRKLVYVRSLDELYQRVPVERAAVPDKVKQYDMKHL